MFTPTCAFPDAVKRVVGTIAVNWLVVTKVVVRFVGEPAQELHQVTVEVPFTKFVPLTVNVTGFAVPAVVLVGVIDPTPAELIVKGSVFDTT